MSDCPSVLHRQSAAGLGTSMEYVLKLEFRWTSRDNKVAQENYIIVFTDAITDLTVDCKPFHSDVTQHSSTAWMSDIVSVFWPEGNSTYISTGDCVLTMHMHSHMKTYHVHASDVTDDATFCKRYESAL